jgi:esterase/lipase superfamily enzyme
MSLSASDNPKPSAVPSIARHYPVFFITDRQQKEQSGSSTLEFTGERSDKITYGIYSPKLVPTGEKIDANEVQVLDSKTKFYDQLKQTGARRVAVFVHGYRKSFAGSLAFGERMASQLSIPVVVFAWPSKNLYQSYMIDECTAEWSSFELAAILKDVGAQYGNENVEVISHSMGARMVSWAYRILASQHDLEHPFGATLFFSPDMDRDTFVAEGPFIKQCSSSFKLYLDKHDSRIWLSKVLHGSPRLGTMDTTASNKKLLDSYEFDTSLPSHQIPFDVLSSTVSPLTSARALPDNATAHR